MVLLGHGCPQSFGFFPGEQGKQGGETLSWKRKAGEQEAQLWPLTRRGLFTGSNGWGGKFQPLSKIPESLQGLVVTWQLEQMWHLSSSDPS